MKKEMVVVLATVALGWAGTSASWSAEVPQFTSYQALTNRELRLRLSGPVGQGLRLEASPDLSEWTGLATLLGASAPSEYTDAAAPFLAMRFYRVAELAGTNLVTGDQLTTSDEEVTIHPINHATFITTWKDKTFYFDPVGGAARFTGLPRADLILVTHSHSDHFDPSTLNAVKGSNTVLLAPLVVYQALSTSLKAIATVLTNGSSTNVAGVQVDAVPAYNLTSANHPKGVGNGYVLTIGGKRIYVSGDTEDVPELRALQNIDVAFVCMNLPFTMSVDHAADAVRQFHPKVVYPYHFSESNVNRFKQLVGTDLGIEVRLRKWY